MKRLSRGGRAAGRTAEAAACVAQEFKRPFTLLAARASLGLSAAGLVLALAAPAAALPGCGGYFGGGLVFDPLGQSFLSTRYGSTGDASCAGAALADADLLAAFGRIDFGYSLLTGTGTLTVTDASGAVSLTAWISALTGAYLRPVYAPIYGAGGFVAQVSGGYLAAHLSGSISGRHDLLDWSEPAGLHDAIDADRPIDVAFGINSGLWLDLSGALAPAASALPAASAAPAAAIAPAAAVPVPPAFGLAAAAAAALAAAGYRRRKHA